MSFTHFIPDTTQWNEYFMKQVESRLNGKKGKKSSDMTSGQIGGGVSVNDEANKLSAVGRVKKKIPDNNKSGSSVKVTLTSPVEASLEQAQSELKNLKEGITEPDAISKVAVKRKGSIRKGGHSNKKKKSLKKFKDVFSK